MIADPEARGFALAEFYVDVGRRLYRDLVEAGLIPDLPDDPVRPRREWDCFALYACVRGLVAAGGFNRETARAIDALHSAVLAMGDRDDEAPRRRRIAERYAEYGGIGQAGGAAGAATVTRRLGEAASRHMIGAEPCPALAEMVGALHESMAEGAAEAVRSGRS